MHVKTVDIDFGDGGCGLSASVTASDRRLSVTLLEEASGVGGKTRLSTGLIRAACSSLQREAGIDDTPERLVEGSLALRMDADCRVLQPDGTAIENLFTGGNAAMSLTGANHLSYVHGNNLMTAFTTGRIAGRTAAKEVLEG